VLGASHEVTEQGRIRRHQPRCDGHDAVPPALEAPSAAKPQASWGDGVSSAEYTTVSCKPLLSAHTARDVATATSECSNGPAVHRCGRHAERASNSSRTEPASGATASWARSSLEGA
jgi:hypothetical protein